MNWIDWQEETWNQKWEDSGDMKTLQFNCSLLTRNNQDLVERFAQSSSLLIGAHSLSDTRHFTVSTLMILLHSVSLISQQSKERIHSTTRNFFWKLSMNKIESQSQIDIPSNLRIIHWHTKEKSMERPKTMKSNTTFQRASLFQWLTNHGLKYFSTVLETKKYEKYKHTQFKITKYSCI